MDFAIISDDLTGAADSGVQFALSGYRTVIFFHGETPDYETDVVVLDTDSRTGDEAEARRRITDAGESVRGAGIVYGKIDSTLRGNLAIGIDALLRATKRGTAIVAPAFPRSGRTTVGGIQLVDGIPVHETEFARDPINPVTLSNLNEILSPIGPVTNLGVEDAGRIGTAISEGRCVVADAEEDAHLAALVRAVPEPSEVLWVGSAGLAYALAAVYSGRGSVTPQEFDAKRVLAVIGSLSRVSREQARFAVEGGRAVPVVLTPDDIEGTISKVRSSLDGGDVVLRSPESGNLTSSEMTAALAAVVSGTSGSFDALVLTGGDTAVGVARRLGATGMEVFGEVEAGVPIGRLVGAVGYPLVTKAGGFGETRTLRFAMDYLGGGT